MIAEFNFDKSYEEIKVNGKIYTIDFSDDAILKYQEAYNRFFKIKKELESSSENSAGDLKKAKDIIEDVIDTFLGEGVFKGIYIESGQSLFNLIDLVNFLSERTEAKFEKLREKNRAKYVKQ